MKKISLYLAGAALAGAAVFCFFAPAFLAEKAEAVSIGEVTSFQLPYGAGGRMCQDLAWDGTYLWCVDSDTHGDVPEIIKIYYDEVAGTGTVVGGFEIIAEPELHKGLAWDGTYLLTAWGGWPKGRIYEIDPGNPGAEPSFIELDFPFPYGLAFHYVPGGAGYLWTVTNDAGYVYQLNRDNGTTVGTPFNVTADIGAERKPAGLAFDGEYLWLAAFGKNDRIFQYTAGGSLVDSFPAYTNQPHATGVTWDDDGDYLWYVDCCTDTFYRIKILFE